MLGTPPYCSPMIRFRKSSLWVMLKACWRMSTKSGLNDLEGGIKHEDGRDATLVQIRFATMSRCF